MVPNCLFIRINRWNLKLSYNDIIYFEAVKKYVSVITELKTYLILASIGEVEKELPPELFCRTHRSYIISMDHIDGFDHEIVRLGNKELPIGRQYRNVLYERIRILCLSTGANGEIHAASEHSMKVV